MAVRCIVIGDVMMDVTAVIDADIAYASDTPAHVTFQPGGVAANTAAWMAIAGHAVTIVGCVGDDPFGRDIRRQLADLGVDVHLQESPQPTGTCVVIVDRRRERTMFPDSGANADLDAHAVTGLIDTGAHVHLSGYTLLNRATRDVGLAALRPRRRGRARPGASTRPRRHPCGPTCRSSSTCSPSSTSCSRTRTRPPSSPAGRTPTTRSRCWPSTWPPSSSRWGPAECWRATLPAPSRSRPCGMTSSTRRGPGDAFTAGFLPVWLAGAPLSQAIEEGQRLAGAAVGRVGASPLAR